MFAREGIEVSSAVRLESWCSMSHEIYADELHLELGPPASSLHLTIAEDVVERLAVLFAETVTQLQGPTE